MCSVVHTTILSSPVTTFNYFYIGRLTHYRTEDTCDVNYKPTLNMPLWSDYVSRRTTLLVNICYLFFFFFFLLILLNQNSKAMADCFLILLTFVSHFCSVTVYKQIYLHLYIERIFTTYKLNKT